VNESLQAALTRLRSSRTTLLAILPVVVAIAFLALVMAFRPGGGQFVGSWRVHDPVSGATMTVRVVRAGGGFELRVPTAHVAPVPYLFKDGKLWPAPGYESDCVLSLVGGRLVMTPPEAPAVKPTPKSAPAATLAPSSTPTAQTSSTPTADPNAQQDEQISQGIHTLQAAVQSWAADHGDVFPTADLVVSTGPFSAYVAAVGSWPTDPVSGQPMKPGSGAGDYTYEQLDGGQSFRLTGYGVDGTPLVTVP